jgi:hypothetical protein
MRTLDAAFLNTVANHPDVRPWLGADEVDLTAAVSNPQNYTLVCETGGFILSPQAPGVYEVHSMFLPGGDALGFMIRCQEWMFTRTDCTAITSKVPKANRAAKGLALKGGLGVIFTRDDALFGPTEYVELDLMKWAMRTASLEAHGERFHALLETVKQDIHPHDAAHERAVGAALLMIERGQPVKGVQFYNRWAMLAGYALITLVSDRPVTIDAVDAVVGLGEDGMEILLCR